MENKIVFERNKNLRVRRSYEEKKATKLGFSSLYDYFEDRAAKESVAAEVKKQNTSLIKNNSVEKINRQEQAACGCCSK